MRSLILILLIGLVHEGCSCSYGWSQYADRRLLFGHVNGPILTVPNVQACQSACSTVDCRLVQYNELTQECKHYSYTMEEVTELNYVSTPKDDPLAANYDLYECNEDMGAYRTCCLIGDPVLKPYHLPDRGHSLKIDQVGRYIFSRSTTAARGSQCTFSTIVVTDTPELWRPHRSIVTSLTLVIGKFATQTIIQLQHTPLTDEIPALRIDGHSVTLPVSPGQYGSLHVSEHDGNIIVYHTGCDISLTFSDFKNSRTCLKLHQDLYPSIHLSGMCGKFDEAIATDSFSAMDYVDT